MKSLQNPEQQDKATERRICTKVFSVKMRASVCS